MGKLIVRALVWGGSRPWTATTLFSAFGWLVLLAGGFRIPLKALDSVLGLFWAYAVGVLAAALTVSVVGTPVLLIVGVWRLVEERFERS